MKKGLTLAALVLVAIAGPSLAASKAVFYEGNGCDQDRLGQIYVGDCDDKKQCVELGEAKSYNLTNGKWSIPNDEARSVKLNDLPEGTIIKVFDDPNRSKKDDWTEITVRQDLSLQTVCVPSFDKDFRDEWIDVEYHEVNGIQGKVSNIRIIAP